MSRSTHWQSRYLLVAMSCIVAASCKSATAPTGYGVDLTLDASTLSARASIAQLMVKTTGDESNSTSFDVHAHPSSDSHWRTRYVPKVASGMLSFEVTAFDGNGQPIGEGSAPVTLVPGRAASVTIALSDVSPMTDGGVDMISAVCSNANKDVGEADVDCGGGCPLCEPGRTCVGDGDCATSTCTKEHCELAPLNMPWESATSLPAARTLAPAVARGDGTVWVLGGLTTAIEDSTLVYSPVTNDWTAGAPLSQPRMEMPAVTVADQLVAIGGLTPTGNTTSDALASILRGGGSPFMWAPLQRTLTQKRVNHGATVGSDGLVYVAGGDLDATPAALASFVSFDAAADSATPPSDLAPLPTARAQLGLASDGAGHIVAMGGRTSAGMGTNAVDLYDIAAKTWSPGPTLAQARRGVAAVLAPDGCVYAVGGQDDTGAAMEDVDVLSGNRTRFTPGAPLVPPRTQVALAVGWEGRIYAVGGQVGGAGALMSTPIVQVYGPHIVAKPDNLAAGATTTVTGIHFAKGAKVTLRLSSETAGPQAGDDMKTLVTSDTGSFSPSFVWVLPTTLATGSYVITAVDDHARYPVRARLVIK